MNREKLAQVIYWKRSFTEDELIETFGTTPSAKPSFRDWLRENLDRLKVLGMLSFDGVRYTLLNPAKKHSSVNV